MTSRYQIQPIETTKGNGWVILDEDGAEVARYRSRLNAAARVLKEEQQDAQIAVDDDGQSKAIWEARTVRA